MSAVMMTLAIAAGTGFAATALAAVILIVRGPTILDRMIGSDVLLTTLILVVGADMVIRGHTNNIALMTAIAATAVFATIVVARFVKRAAEIDAARDSETEGPREETQGVDHV